MLLYLGTRAGARALILCINVSGNKEWRALHLPSVFPLSGTPSTLSEFYGYKLQTIMVLSSLHFISTLEYKDRDAIWILHFSIRGTMGACKNIRNVRKYLEKDTASSSPNPSLANFSICCDHTATAVESSCITAYNPPRLPPTSLLTPVPPAAPASGWFLITGAGVASAV